MKIKILEKTAGCMPNFIKKGDWIDVCLAEDVILKGPYSEVLKKRVIEGETERYRNVVFDSTIARLGICIETPKGFEAHLVPRSSLFKDWGVIQSNSIGIIDNSFSSEKDEWKIPLIALSPVIIPKGTRIAQFRIELKQTASVWQKIKWLFTNKIILEKVDSLKNVERGGFGSTGKN